MLGRPFRWLCPWTRRYPGHRTCDSATADRVLAFDPATQTYEMACTAIATPGAGYDNHWLANGFEITSIQLTPGKALAPEPHGPFTGSIPIEPAVIDMPIHG